MQDNNSTFSSLNSSIDDTYPMVTVEKNYYPLKVIVPLYGQVVLLISLLTCGFLLPVFYQNEVPYTTDTFSIVIYLQLIVWMLITILTWFIKAEHKTSRILGYHDFYDSTRFLHRVAFYLLSGGNVLMLIVTCVTHNFCLGGGISSCGIHISLTPVNYLQIVIVFEVALALPFLTKHIVEVFRFNQKRQPPDVFRGHLAHSDPTEIIIGSRGFSNIEKLLGQQADQLMTLNHRNELLYQQLYSLIQRQEEV